MGNSTGKQFDDPDAIKIDDDNWNQYANKTYSKSVSIHAKNTLKTKRKTKGVIFDFVLTSAIPDLQTNQINLRDIYNHMKRKRNKSYYRNQLIV